jgi:hypothetical protein
LTEARRHSPAATKECEEFLEQLSAHFKYLFDEYGSQAVATDGDRLGEHCLVVLQSSHFRIRFIVNQGHVEAALGTLAAPPTWEDRAAGEVVWFSMREVCEFLRGNRRPSPKDLRELGDRLFRMSADEYLEWLSDSLRPVMDQANLLFGGDASGRAKFLEYYGS